MDGYNCQCVPGYGVSTVRKTCKNASQRLVRMVVRARILLPTTHVIVQRAFTALTASSTRMNVPQAPANMAEFVLLGPAVSTVNVETAILVILVK